jgi:hypothetical protein
MSEPDRPKSTHPKKPVIKAVHPHETRPETRDLQDRARIAEEVKGSLDRVRKTAENWRTGMAGLATLVTATLLFKGRGSIIDYADWVGYTLGALVLLSLIFAVAALWLFLTAAYGRLRPTSAQSILDAGGVDVHNFQLTKAALHDLTMARRLALAGAGFLALGLVISWYGPVSRPSTPRVKLVIASETSPRTELSLCGELTALDGNIAVLQIDAEPDPRRLKTGQLISLKIVASCDTAPNGER